MGERPRRVFRRILGGLVLVVLVAAAALGFTHRQDISDYFSAKAFEPSARVSEVMQQLDLTPRGERVFLASHPTIDGSQAFNDQCAEVDHSEQGHVLGCYTQGQIRLFEVTDERVKGIVEVTAAHEMLHAVYSRLGDGERRELADELRDAYASLSAENPELKERMKVYEHLSDSAFANELHSVLGTEVRDLPEALEKHYARWFQDRSALIDTFDAFHSVFSDLQKQADALQDEMNALRERVDAGNAAYEADVEQFNRDTADFRARNDRYEFASNPAEFERIRDELNARRESLEETLASLQADVERYNELRDQLLQLGQVSDELDQQLNSDLAPATTRPTA